MQNLVIGVCQYLWQVTIQFFTKCHQNRVKIANGNTSILEGSFTDRIGGLTTVALSKFWYYTSYFQTELEELLQNCNNLKVNRLAVRPLASLNPSLCKLRVIWPSRNTTKSHAMPLDFWLKADIYWIFQIKTRFLEAFQSYESEKKSASFMSYIRNARGRGSISCQRILWGPVVLQAFL